jgi:hypothetical protein
MLGKAMDMGVAHGRAPLRPGQYTNTWEQSCIDAMRLVGQFWGGVQRMKKKLFYQFTFPLLVSAIVLTGCNQDTTDEVDGHQVDPTASDSNTTNPEGKGDSNASAPSPGPAGEYTIKEVMQQGFKADGNLKDLILDGTATAEQRAKFVSYMENLAKYKVRKGAQEDFEKRVAPLITAAKGTDLAALKEAVNCKSCHTPHKIYPPKKQ